MDIMNTQGRISSKKIGTYPIKKILPLFMSKAVQISSGGTLKKNLSSFFYISVIKKSLRLTLLLVDCLAVTVFGFAHKKGVSIGMQDLDSQVPSFQPRLN